VWVKIISKNEHLEFFYLLLKLLYNLLFYFLKKYIYANILKFWCFKLKLPMVLILSNKTLAVKTQRILLMYGLKYFIKQYYRAQTFKSEPN